MAESSGNHLNSDAIPRPKGKQEEDESVNSSTAQEESLRPPIHPKKLRLYVKLRENDRDHHCFDTNGKETILKMVKRMIEEEGFGKYKPNTDWLLFQCDSDKSYMNIGLPTGALSENERYSCSFKKREDGKKKFADMIRLYDVEDFDESWNLSSFTVHFEKNKHRLVSDMQRIVNILKVNYFPGESLFEALFRDGRFSYTDSIHKSDFQTKRYKVFLSSEATSDAFKIIKRAAPNNKTEALAKEGIPPLKKPGAVVVKQELTDPQMTSTTVRHEPPEIKPEVKKLPKHSSIMKEYFEKNYGLKLEKETDQERENNRKKEIDKVAGKHYIDFALNYEHRVFVSDLEEVLTLKLSVGAVIVTDGKENHCYGTCFRVGEKYVLTNCHVLKSMEADSCKLDHVDFNYQESEGYCFNFDSMQPLLVFSHEYDYAILQLHLDSETNLPLAVTELGYSIPSPEFHLPEKECLTLMGHPGAQRKQIDVSCPLRRSEIKEQEYIVLSLHKLCLQDPQSHEQRYFGAAQNSYSEPYDVSTFFEGASGSPGLLIGHKLLVVLHCRGVDLPGAKQRYSVEEGILVSFIVKDVQNQKEKGHRNLINIDLENIFGHLDFSPQPMV